MSKRPSCMTAVFIQSHFLVKISRSQGCFHFPLTRQLFCSSASCSSLSSFIQAKTQPSHSPQSTPSTWLFSLRNCTKPSWYHHYHPPPLHRYYLLQKPGGKFCQFTAFADKESEVQRGWGAFPVTQQTDRSAGSCPRHFPSLASISGGTTVYLSCFTQRYQITKPHSEIVNLFPLIFHSFQLSQGKPTGCF